MSFIRKAKNLAPTALQFRLTTRRMHGWIQKFSDLVFSFNFFLQEISFWNCCTYKRKHSLELIMHFLIQMMLHAAMETLE